MTGDRKRKNGIQIRVIKQCIHSSNWSWLFSLWEEATIFWMRTLSTLSGWAAFKTLPTWLASSSRVDLSAILRRYWWTAIGSVEVEEARSRTDRSIANWRSGSTSSSVSVLFPVWLENPREVQTLKQTQDCWILPYINRDGITCPLPPHHCHSHWKELWDPGGVGVGRFEGQS